MDDNKNTSDCQTVVFTVYVMWCRCTDMYYVGVTGQKVYRRIRRHKRGKQFVDREIQRIGWDGNRDWWVVEENVPSDRISAREQHWVAHFDSVYPNGYNKTCGGIGNLTVSDDTREIIRQNARTRDMSGENNPHYGKHHTAEIKAEQSARMKGENNPMYGKSPANKGVPHTDEEKAKISAKLSGENNPNFGKPMPETTKAKLRVKALARVAAKKSAQETP